MRPEELKKLEEEHKKVMEGIAAMNKALKEDIKATKDYLGVK